MFGSEVLEVAIGLVFLYLLLSLICSSIREGIEAVQKARAIDLERGIRELLHDRGGTGLASALYNHPLVFGLFQGEYDPTRLTKGRMPGRGNLPSYIPARNFSAALLDIVARGKGVAAGTGGQKTAADAGTTPISLESLRAGVVTLDNEAVRRALLTAIDTAQGDLQRAQANVEAWFNSSMDRVSGWYKRRTQNIIFAVGLLLTIAVNADTLAVAGSLVRDEALRRAVIASAERPVAGAAAGYEALTTMAFPIGWSQLPSAVDVARHVPGWLMTALAISLGAPFWFDVLNKFMVIRSTVKPHEKSPEEASEDRQPAGA